jgi:dienelactone hydrolase
LDTLTAVRIEAIGYEGAGRRRVGQRAVDKYRVGPRRAVLLCREGPGLDEHVKGRAARLAGMRYAAFALDYHGGGRLRTDPVPELADEATSQPRGRQL